MANKLRLKKSSVAARVPTTSDLDYGELALNYTDGKLYYKKSDGTTIDSFTAGAGDVDGPASSTDNAVARFDGTTGKVIQNSNVTIDDSGNLGIGTTSPTNRLSVTGNANVTGNVTLGDASTDTVTVNGYMGVGGAANAAYNILATGASTSGSNQYSVGATATLSGTSHSAAFLASNSIAASTAVSNATGLRAVNITLGSGATIISQHGVRIEDLTSGTNNFGITSLVSSGTNKWNIYASGTAANYFAGNVQFAAGSAAAPALTRFGDDNTGIFFPAADTIAFSEGGAESMRITSAGNVGIGTSSPAVNLELSASSTTTGPIFRLSNTNNTISAGGTHGSVEFWSGDDSNPANQVVCSITSIMEAIAPNYGALAFSTQNNTEGMRLDSSGNFYTANGKIGPNGTQQHTMPAVASDTYTLNAATQTLTNKRIDPRVVSTASASSLTPSIATADVYAYTALAAALTINAPTGTPLDGDKLMFRILDNGTTQTLTWNATYTPIGAVLPTATVANKMTYVGCIYNAANTRWDVIAVTTQV